MCNCKMTLFNDNVFDIVLIDFVSMIPFKFEYHIKKTLLNHVFFLRWELLKQVVLPRLTVVINGMVNIFLYEVLELFRGAGKP